MANAFTPTGEEVGERMDLVLVRRFPEHSRHFWQQALKAGYVTRGEHTVTASSKAAENEYAINLPNDTPGPINIPIVYEDDDIVVINKPSGLLSHTKGNFNPEFTIADFMSSKVDEADSNRAGIVHRLDRDTSGVMVCAKTESARVNLQKQFSTRKVIKTYLAIAHGTFKDQEGIIDAPIQRNPRKPQLFRVNAQGKAAQTGYKVLTQGKDRALVELTPKTGRTHQLRVHLHHIGHPIVGDAFYGTDAAKSPRLMLHAASLTLTLPTSHKKQTFAVPLPPEWPKTV